MAQFQVKQTFEIAAREYFVLCGNVVEGTIAKGMTIIVPMNSAVQMTLPIAGIELLTGKEGTDLALCVRAKPEERELLRGVNLGDETLEIVGPNDSSGG